MALDTNGNAYLTGGHYANVKMDSTNGAIDLLIYQDSGSATANGIALDSVANVFVTGLTNTSTGGNDFATIKYDNNGNQLWVARYNGPANGNDGGNAIAVAPDGFIYVTGYSANASGGTDIVTIKYAPGPFLRKQANGNFLLQAEGAAGQSFDFQASTNLQAWQDLGTNTADTNGTVQFLDTISLSFPSRFYLATPQ